MSRSITDHKDLMDWAKEVNMGNYKSVCDLQDIFARSDEKTLKTFFLDAGKYDREMIVFAINKAMGQERMFEFVKTWARRQAEIVIRDNDKALDARFDELNEARRAFDLEKETIAKEKRDLEIDRDRLSMSCLKKQDQIANLYETQIKLYAQINELESDNEMLASANEKLSQFESHIQGLLKAA